ncbi:MAG TPA: dTDP-4-amino-4,6-dideoxygalactose transaminase [Cytophagaceae bacterium]
MIPFNRPFIIGKELDYIKQAVESGKISGDGLFTKKCQQYMEDRYGFKKVLLTSSCTDALEMCAILSDIQEGDEVIMPSFTFVSTANAFVLRGANIVFCDIRPDTLNIDASRIEPLITPKTKAIVVVHYAGVACDMDPIMSIARKHRLLVIEDAALATEAFYKQIPLGSIGDLATYSFHETKNIIAGEGGALLINNESFIERAEIIREKGTNRSKFFRGETDKYNWVDIGSSFLPSEIIAAFLYGQLEQLEDIQKKRISIWNKYYQSLQELETQGFIRRPVIPGYATVNGQMFYILCRSLKERSDLIVYLLNKNIKAVFHYLPLHSSPFYKERYSGKELEVTDRVSDTLLRLPLFYNLTDEEQEYIINSVYEFYHKL